MYYKHKIQDLSHDQHLQAMLEEAITVLKAKEQTGGLLDITVDNMAMMISSHGDHFAAELMENLVDHVQHMLKVKDVVMQKDKDRIYVILKNYDPHELKTTAQSIMHAIQNFGSTVATAPIQLIATIGMVSLPDQAGDAKDAISKAYIARGQAHEQHQHVHQFSQEENHDLANRNQLILASYLQNAIRNHRLTLAYQPVVDGQTNQPILYEALLRIINEDGTVTSAGPFIPVAEKMGFIDMIDGLVLEMVVQELMRYPSLRLSMNVSNASIFNNHWQKMALILLDDPKIARRLTIEITETAPQNDLKKAACFVDVMKVLGCKVALDDFGAGYTSFSQLKTLPIHIVKIDGAFIRDLSNNPKNQAMVQSITDLCTSLKLTPVAEFVENEKTCELVQKLGIRYMQGNYFAAASVERQ